MLEPEVRKLLESPPPGVDPREWDGLSEGDRLRVLKNAHYLLTLDEKQRRAIRRLPSWVAHGPADLPDDWFNPRGLLLPKYRPGGGRYREFREHQRLVRIVVRIEERALADWDRLAARYGLAAQMVLGLTVVAALVYLIFFTFAAWLPPYLRAGVLGLLLGASFYGSRYVLANVLRQIFVRCRLSRVLRRRVAWHDR